MFEIEYWILRFIDLVWNLIDWFSWINWMITTLILFECGANTLFVCRLNNILNKVQTKITKIKQKTMTKYWSQMFIQTNKSKLSYMSDNTRLETNEQKWIQILKYMSIVRHLRQTKWLTWKALKWKQQTKSKEQNLPGSQ